MESVKENTAGQLDSMNTVTEAEVVTNDVSLNEANLRFVDSNAIDRIINEVVSPNLGFIGNRRVSKRKAKAFLEALDYELSTALDLHRHALDVSRETGRYYLDLSGDVLKNRIHKGFTIWFEKSGIGNKIDCLKIMISFGEDLETVKQAIGESSLQSDNKSLMVKVADALWNEACEKMFKDVLHRIVGRPAV